MSANSTSPADVGAVFHLLEKTDYSPILASALATFALWGILYMQIYTYYSSDISTQDRFYVKIIVAVAAIMECFLTFLYADIAYFYLIYNFGNPAELAVRPWTLNILFGSRELQMLFMRFLFLRRLYILSHGNKILTAWILLWTLVEFSAGVAVTVLFFSFGPVLTYPKSFYHATYVGEASVYLTDISLATALCYYLYKSRTGIKRTDSILRLAILYCISTSAIVVVFAILSITLFLVLGTNYVNFPFFVVQTKLYLITYMVTLNGRENLRTQREEPQSVNLSSFTHTSTQMHSGGVPSEKPTFSDTSVGTTVEI